MRIKTWQIIVLVICLLLGTLLHFTYDLSGNNKTVALFSAVNESTWEHLKLVFYPMLLMAIIGYFIIGKKSYNYWLAQAVGIIVAISFITIFFYTYSGIIGKNFSIINIAIFAIAMCLGVYITYRILVGRKIYNIEVWSIFFLIILLLSFILYTFNPPQIQFFQDPITKVYGI